VERPRVVRDGSEEWLGEFSTSTLIAAIESNGADASVLEGGSRFWSRRGAGDLRAIVPSYLRRRLLEHVREGGDADKLEAAARALADR
jgi:hypothetical protein